MIKKLLLLIFTFSVLLFIGHTFYTKTSVFADSKFYYSYTRSVVFDHNLLLGNEYFNLGLLSAVPKDQFMPIFYPPGVSIMWLPLFYITYGLFNFIKLIFPGFVFNGHEILFELSCGLTNILLGIFGLLAVYKILIKKYSEKVSFYTLALLFFTTNLLFYIAVEPVNSHAASFFMDSIFLFYFLNKQDDKYYYFFLGVIGGIAGIIRTQDILLLIIPIIGLFIKHYKNIKVFILSFLQITVGSLVGFMPQILLWKYFYNTFWYSPYFDVGFSFFRAQILHVLFNSQNGLFTITPVIFISVASLTVLTFNFFKNKKDNTSKNDREVYVYSLIYFFLQLYVVSSWKEYTQGGSYSIRMMVTTYPFLSIGFAELIDKIKNKFGEKKVIYGIIGFTVYNIFLLIYYLLRF